MRMKYSSSNGFAMEAMFKGAKCLTIASISSIFILGSWLQAATSKPNVLVVLMDDYGVGQFGPLAKQLNLTQLDPSFLAYSAQLEAPYDYDPQVALEASQRATPFMDALAEQGILFTSAFAASNLCAPSRQGILTGTNPTRWGVYRNIDINAFGMPEGRSLVTHFKDLGYHTGFIGKWHMGIRDHALRSEIRKQGGSDEDVMRSGYLGSVRIQDHPLKHGFDYAFFYNRWECPYYDYELIWENYEHTGLQTEYNTDKFTEVTIGFIERSLHEGKPFFAELALHSVHTPLEADAPEKYTSYFDTGYPQIDRFYSHIYAVDQSVKRIVDMLKERGEWDNTILFFTSDNGATSKVGKGDLSLIPGNGPFRGHKGQNYLGGIRVPLLMTWPDQIRGPKQIEQAVSLMDMLPTALDAAGGELPDMIDGKSLLPMLKGSETAHHKELYFVGIQAAAWGFDEEKTLVNAQQNRDQWHGSWAIVDGDYILRYVGTLKPSLEKAYPDGRAPYYSLHNIKSDPLEQINLYKQHPELAERMKAKYNAYAQTLPPPHGWNRSIWEELVPTQKK